MTDTVDLKARRKAAGLSQETLAMAAGLSRKTIQRIESGSSVSLDTIANVEAVFAARGEAAVVDSDRSSLPSGGATPVRRTPDWKAFAVGAAAVFGIVVVMPSHSAPTIDRSSTFVSCVNDKALMHDDIGVLYVDPDDTRCAR